MYILDTNILMSVENYEELFNEMASVGITIESLYELDKLKIAEGEKGFKARRAIRNIERFSSKFTFLKQNQLFYHKFNRATIQVDDIIISYFKKKKIRDNDILVTNDIGMKIKAKGLNIKTRSYYQDRKLVEWAVTRELPQKEYAKFCEEYDNKYGVAIGQYFIVKNSNNPNMKTILKYVGVDHWKEINQKQKISNYLFKVSPKDDNQICAMDSLVNDPMTVITGPAGTGKTLLSLAYCLKRMKEDNTKVNIFINPVKTRGSEELGFYPGSRNEKLLQNFIGDILRNKIGDMSEVYSLLESGLLNIYPMSDIRGIEVGKDQIMYITEAQNLSIDLIKLAIQRCADGAKVILEGDPFTQVDKTCFEGESNGLRRVIKVFSGYEDYGYVQLTNIYRSKLAEKAEEL